MTTPKQQIAFPEVAILRKGTPKVKGQNGFIQGKDLGQKFRISFYPGTTDSRNAWQAAHPESYVKYDLTYRLPGTYAEPDGFEIERLRAMVPFRSVFDAWEWANEAHSAGRMVAKADDDHYLMKRDPLTGAYLVQNGEPYTEFHHGDEIRYEKNNKTMVLPIRTVGRLRLFVPELERMVFITLKTTSFYDRLNIDANLSALQFLANTLNGGNAAGIPFYIYRREQEICWNKPDGSAQRIKKWLVNIEADPEWVKVAQSRMANFALTGMVSQALLAPPPPPAMTAAVNPFDEPDEPGDEFLPSPSGILEGQVTELEPEPPAEGTTGQLDQDFPPLPADWQAAKAAKEAEKPRATQPEPLKPAERPYLPEVFKAKFEAAVQLITEKNHLDKIGDRERQIVASALDGIFNGEKTKRYEVCKWLTGKASTKDMGPAQIKALLLIMGIDDYNQPPKAEAMTELKQAHTAALEAGGQGKLL